MAKSRLTKTIIIFSVIIPLLAVVLAIYLLWGGLVGWRDIAIMIGMYIACALGITVGFHRMLTHRSFEGHPWVRAVFLGLGTMAMQGPPLHWASDHIKHHAHTDKEGDPHSPLEGFFHSHLGWLVTANQADPRKYGRWLLKDKQVMFFSHTWYIWVGLGMLIPFLLGGWTGLLWGGLVRMFLLNHVTWSVNSVCHTFGRQMFHSDDVSKNNWIVGLLAMGEGWHNNHHAFPKSAFHGMRWWQFDLSSYVIWTLEKLGLAWDVHRVPQDKLEARLIKRGRLAEAAAAAGAAATAAATAAHQAAIQAAESAAQAAHQAAEAAHQAAAAAQQAASQAASAAHQAAIQAAEAASAAAHQAADAASAAAHHAAEVATKAVSPAQPETT